MLKNKQTTNHIQPLYRAASEVKGAEKITKWYPIRSFKISGSFNILFELGEKLLFNDYLVLFYMASLLKLINQLGINVCWVQTT